jgi:hypothetical protein
VLVPHFNGAARINALADPLAVGFTSMRIGAA